MGKEFKCKLTKAKIDSISHFTCSNKTSAIEVCFVH